MHVGEAEIAEVQGPDGDTHYELRGVPESGKARLEALFQVGSGRVLDIRQRPHLKDCLLN